MISIVDVHHYEEMISDPHGHKARFLGLCSQISEHFASSPDTLYLELLNEPWGDHLTAELWNSILAEALDIIRRKNPTRPVVVGPVMWNSYHALNRFVLPEKDRNIIVGLHNYEPFEFSHQGAYWVNPVPPAGQQWGSDEAMMKMVNDGLDRTAAWGGRARPAFVYGGIRLHQAGKRGLQSRIPGVHGPGDGGTGHSMDLLGLLRRFQDIRQGKRPLDRAVAEGAHFMTYSILFVSSLFYRH